MRNGSGFRFMAALAMFILVTLFAIGAFGAGIAVGVASDTTGWTAGSWHAGQVVSLLITILAVIVLFRLILGLYTPKQGSVLINGRDYSHSLPLERAKVLAIVFQENYTGFPFTVEQVVRLGRHPHQNSVLIDSKEDMAATEAALDLLGMMDFRNRLFRTLIEDWRRQWGRTRTRLPAT